MCEETILKEYDDKIVDLAKKIVAKQALDSNATLCSADYLKAKRYKRILHYLADDVCCPGKVRDDIIEKLHLNAKF